MGVVCMHGGVDLQSVCSSRVPSCGLSVRTSSLGRCSFPSGTNLFLNQGTGCVASAVLVLPLYRYLCLDSTLDGTGVGQYRYGGGGICFTQCSLVNSTQFLLGTSLPPLGVYFYFN